MKKPALRLLGLAAVLLGAIGVVVPLLPTTPFLILAAYCFARSHPEWEARLLSHRSFGPAILAWRDRRAIPRLAKLTATGLMAISILVGWLTLPDDWRWLPLGIAGLLLGWMWSRPDA